MSRLKHKYMELVQIQQTLFPEDIMIVAISNEITEHDVKRVLAGVPLNNMDMGAIISHLIRRAEMNRKGSLYTQYNSRK